MSNTKVFDGGPAFAHGNPGDGGHPGMSLRDWYAGMAMAAYINAGFNWDASLVMGNTDGGTKKRPSGPDSAGSGAAPSAGVVEW